MAGATFARRAATTPNTPVTGPRTCLAVRGPGSVTSTRFDHTSVIKTAPCCGFARPRQTSRRHPAVQRPAETYPCRPARSAPAGHPVDTRRSLGLWVRRGGEGRHRGDTWRRRVRVAVWCSVGRPRRGVVLGRASPPRSRPRSGVPAAVWYSGGRPGAVGGLVGHEVVGHGSRSGPRPVAASGCACGPAVGPPGSKSSPSRRRSLTLKRVGSTVIRPRPSWRPASLSGASAEIRRSGGPGIVSWARAMRTSKMAPGASSDSTAGHSLQALPL